MFTYPCRKKFRDSGVYSPSSLLVLLEFSYFSINSEYAEVYINSVFEFSTALTNAEQAADSESADDLYAALKALTLAQQKLDSAKLELAKSKLTTAVADAQTGFCIFAFCCGNGLFICIQNFVLSKENEKDTAECTA